MDDLNNLVLELARARAEVAEAHARLVALMASTAIIEAQADEHFAKERVADLEDAVRKAALEEYARSGNKRPHPAVSMRINKRLRYDVGAALEYCRQNFNAAVKTVLDTKVFEKVAPNLGLDFVEVAEEPQATIASDLTDYLLALETQP